MSATTHSPQEERYALVQRLLHWLIAILVIGALAGGAALWFYGFEGLRTGFGMDVTNAIYKYHKTAGVLILGLMLLRLVLRLVLGAPAAPASMTSSIAMAAHVTHVGLYALLILMPVVGWAATATGGFPIQFFDLNLPPLFGKNEALSATLYRVHGILGAAIGALIFLHVGAALRHWLILKDGVMRRIGFP